MDEDQIFVQSLKIEDVPRHSLTTPYGRATDFPEYLYTIQNISNIEEVKTALGEIISNIEHQGIFWGATPFAMVFLACTLKQSVSGIDKNSAADYITAQILEFFELMVECYQDELDLMEGAGGEPLLHFSDMLNEEYLWSEEYSEEEDDKRYAEGGFCPDELFFSLYDYSYQVIVGCKPILRELENTRFHQKAQRLLEICS